jgi:hypothetical protein
VLIDGLGSHNRGNDVIIDESLKFSILKLRELVECRPAAWEFLDNAFKPNPLLADPPKLFVIRTSLFYFQLVAKLVESFGFQRCFSFVKRCRLLDNCLGGFFGDAEVARYEVLHAGTIINRVISQRLLVLVPCLMFVHNRLPRCEC